MHDSYTPLGGLVPMWLIQLGEVVFGGVGSGLYGMLVFAIIPAAFASTYPVLDNLNIMRLATPTSAILSAVIFNALIIVALIPLALRGVKYRPIGAAALLRNNLLVFGLGGLVAPFPGIKLIDMLLAFLGVA
jgi:K+-transporting ATPase ATPase B chain